MEAKHNLAWRGLALVLYAILIVVRLFTLHSVPWLVIAIPLLIWSGWIVIRGWRRSKPPLET